MINQIKSSDEVIEIANYYYDLDTVFPGSLRPERIEIVMEIARLRLEELLYLKTEQKREEIEQAIIEKLRTCDKIVDIEKIYCLLKSAYPHVFHPERIGAIMEIASQRRGIIIEKERKAVSGI